ncbi:MAG: hypothetical protein KDA53_04390 [Hyphomonas sp.]|nr:hypothetical protein [Hyphomonas sp.]
MAGRIVVSILLFAVIAVIGVFTPPASADEGQGPAAFGPRDFPLSVDTYSSKKRDGTKDGVFVIHGHRAGNSEAERLFAAYSEIRAVNGQTFGSAPALYHYISNLDAMEADITFARRADGQEVTETVTLAAQRPDAACGSPQRIEEGVTTFFEFCGKRYRLVTRSQLLACARPAMTSINNFLTPRSDPPCALIGQDIVMALGQHGCRRDQSSALVAGTGLDTKNNADFSVYLRGDTDALAMEAARASWDCHALLGDAVEPARILGIAFSFDYPHFFYFGRLHVSEEKETGSWVTPVLRKDRVYMVPDHVLFAESASQYEYEPNPYLYGGID